MCHQAKLLASLQQAPDGLTLAHLLGKNKDLTRRTAQRWIQALIVDHQVIVSGQARNRRYYSANQRHKAQNHTEANSYANIPLSANSQDIIAYVNQPIEARKPVAYQRDFLLRYEPNRTYYLTSSQRQQLARMGRAQPHVAPAGTYGRAILNRLLIDLSWASSHLEGNTYTRLDTQQLIEQGQAAQGKAAMETQMILNHKTAIELLVEHAETVQFDRYTLMNIHSALAENLLPNPADEGRIRQHEVNIAKSVFRPLSIPAQISELFDVLLDKAAQIVDPFEQSFFMMVQIPYLQAFADINKRTARMAANIPLIQANLCPLTFLDVPENAYIPAILGVYELTRIELLRDLYLWAYERSTQEYIAIKHDIVEPDPLRLTHRDFIRKTLHAIVSQPEQDPLRLIAQALAHYTAAELEKTQIEGIVIDELRRLHEGVLARYGLRLADFKRWRDHQVN